MLFVPVIRADRCFTGDVLIEEFLGARLATMLGRNFLVRRRLLALFDGVTFKATAFFGQRLRCLGVEVGRRWGARGHTECDDCPSQSQ